MGFLNSPTVTYYRAMSRRGKQDALTAPKPANLGYAEAAALPARGGLTLHFLGQGQVQAGQRVLVFGATGANGRFAVQVARYPGMRDLVIQSANPGFVRTPGADAAIDYTPSTSTQPTSCT